jgi:ABC-type transport system involved in multi-copper enzyme maturation permease subunit
MTFTFRIMTIAWIIALVIHGYNNEISPAVQYISMSILTAACMMSFAICYASKSK